MANLVAKYNFNYRIMSLYGLCLLLLLFFGMDLEPSRRKSESKNKGTTGI